MASPQLENGYTKIANEILEHLIWPGINGGELKLVLFVIRKTFGYRKKHDKIALSQFQKSLLCKRANVCRTIRSLVAKRLLLKDNRGFKFNKNWEEWLVAKRLPSSQTDNGLVAKRLPKVVAKRLHTKESKESITKEITSSSDDSLEKPMWKLEPDSPDREIQLDTLEERSTVRQEERTHKGYDPKDTNLLLNWGVEKLGRKFTKPLKQKKHIADMLAAGSAPEDIKAKWEELEEDKFWSRKGIDFSVVASQIDKIKPKESSLIWDEQKKR